MRDRQTDPILIAGPTASGKSALALALAENLGGAVVNADAIQVYDGWQILSARPDAADLARAPHRLYGHIAMDVAYSVGHWLRDVDAALDACRGAGQRPIIVGGTGLYLSALTEGLAQIPPVPADVRAEGDALRRDGGTDGLRAALVALDPAALDHLDPFNPARLQRAWEVLRATGRTLRDWQADTPPPLVPLEASTALVLTSAPAWLNARITRRFGQMVDLGALNEVARAHEAGLDPAWPSSRALGADALWDHLQGRMSRDAALALGALRTRQFAKRQRTWFRNRMTAWRTVRIDETPAEDLVSSIV
ncbi:tRNA (adenosine(37)-N6)-dimethylallyltransferase MiaA [Oceanomicrobium pacificus]|uniref:tRNA dimethylallyltransferase n=1 Tax=Oceanomicrobium pacificus TaxID=2692916 RepID=A0A6B0TPD6_9RHOB|nr:tRNA (adenosine(37)-N6)-dimethylallyltransferase MiaA [Oceanomicrobium pacificus]MXU65756.1 tRNA (adenosine(37)-N6)-dimethylallyltransferase MiaA [Oceanomicrobium pacificus]